jgi:hypothetical protein
VGSSMPDVDRGELGGLAPAVWARRRVDGAWCWSLGRNPHCPEHPARVAGRLLRRLVDIRRLRTFASRSRSVSVTPWSGHGEPENGPCSGKLLSSHFPPLDPAGIAGALAANVRWTIPGRRPLSGIKRGIPEVLAFFDQLGKTGF